MASILLGDFVPGDRVRSVQFIAGLAMVSALQEIFTGSFGISPSPDSFPIKLKWPNDIYTHMSDGRLLKIGGVLVTAVHQGSELCASVGVGLNVSNMQPTTCVHSILRDMDPKISDSDVQSYASRERVLATFLNHLDELLEVLSDEGFSALHTTYKRYWLHEGQELYIGHDKVPMTVQGLSQDGYLEAVDASGQLHVLHPDGNSLDMMTGLVSKKA
eukprot:jgi/Ulvmu1/2633/UM014_0085.1